MSRASSRGFLAASRLSETLGLQSRGTRGESGGQTGITYDISNNQRLGYTKVRRA